MRVSEIIADPFFFYFLHKMFFIHNYCHSDCFPFFSYRVSLIMNCEL